MIKANPFYHWVQSKFEDRPKYARVKIERGTKCTNRPRKPCLPKRLKMEVRP
jgi:hypothetical protein